jgi:hypothetical protein
MVSAYAFLAQGYRLLNFHGESRGSTAACGACLPKKIYKWTVPAEQVQQRLEHLRHIYVHPLRTGKALLKGTSAGVNAWQQCQQVAGSLS